MKRNYFFLIINFFGFPKEEKNLIKERAWQNFVKESCVPNVLFKKKLRQETEQMICQVLQSFRAFWQKKTICCFDDNE
jgi:hypothetical protein